MAGCPVTQMATHVPIFNRPCASFDKSSYNLIRATSVSKGGNNIRQLSELYASIKHYGLTEALKGWDIGSNTYELFGGHHRAVIAYVLGIKEVPFIKIPFDVFTVMSTDKIKAIREVYNKVSKKERMKRGVSYNPFPGMKAIRESKGRLMMIYRDIINCHGNKLLDVGCNDGYFGTNLSKHNFDVTFVDRSGVFLDVARAKMEALEKEAVFHHVEIEQLLDHLGSYDVIIYLDVFYHTVREYGLGKAFDQLTILMNATKERFIFSPGRWDKLEKCGCTQKDLFNAMRKAPAKRIRYLGKDNDDGYGREIYSVHY
jgi:hypothetical protein